jgi:hypothetical protein
MPGKMIPVKGRGPKGATKKPKGKGMPGDQYKPDSKNPKGNRRRILDGINEMNNAEKKKARERSY